jgi:hypothetical protein
MNGVLAWTMALSHLSLVVFLITGAWFPRLRPLHLLAVGATAAVFLAGADCPLTVWENHFRAAAGWDTYGEGFVAHYLWRPAPVWVVAAWLVPTVVAYLVAGSGTNRYRHASAGPSSTST